MFVNREEFEKLPQIQSILKRGFFEYSEYTGGYVFCDAMNCINARPSQHKDHGYLNGAWYAWQEKQKKMTQAYITLGEALNNTPDNYEDAIREAMDDLK